MIPDQVKYIDTLRKHKDEVLQMLRGIIRDKEKRKDIKIVMMERGLIK